MDLSGLLLISALSLLFLAALALLFRGLRGRRIDDHPLCRNCRFDLSGNPAATACPECGRDVSTPASRRTGNRRRIRWMTATGLTLFFLSASAAALIGYGIAKNINWQHYKPAWWLQVEFHYGSPPTASAATDELFDRFHAGTLSDAFIRNWIPDALAVQGDLSLPWDAKWGDLVQSARLKNLVTDDQWSLYGRQAIAGALTFTIRPRIRFGDPIAERWSDAGFRTSASYGKSSVSYLKLAFKTEENRCTIDGKPVSYDLGRSGWALFPNSKGNSWGTFSVSPPLALGRHQCEFTGNAAIEPMEGLAPTGEINLGVLAFKSTFEVVADDSVRLIHDPALRQKIQSSLHPESVDVSKNGTASIIFGITAPPCDLACKIIAKSDAGQYDLGAFSVSAGEPTSYTTGSSDPFPDGITQVDLLLRPDRATAIGTVNILDIWGEEIIFKNIPVHRSP